MLLGVIKISTDKLPLRLAEGDQKREKKNPFSAENKKSVIEVIQMPPSAQYCFFSNTGVYVGFEPKQKTIFLHQSGQTLARWDHFTQDYRSNRLLKIDADDEILLYADSVSSLKVICGLQFRDLVNQETVVKINTFDAFSDNEAIKDYCLIKGEPKVAVLGSEATLAIFDYSNFFKKSKNDEILGEKFLVENGSKEPNFASLDHKIKLKTPIEKGLYQPLALDCSENSKFLAVSLQNKQTNLPEIALIQVNEHFDNEEEGIRELGTFLELKDSYKVKLKQETFPFKNVYNFYDLKFIGKRGDYQLLSAVSFNKSSVYFWAVNDFSELIFLGCFESKSSFGVVPQIYYDEGFDTLWGFDSHFSLIRVKVGFKRSEEIEVTKKASEEIQEEGGDGDAPGASPFEMERPPNTSWKQFVHKIGNSHDNEYTEPEEPAESQDEQNLNNQEEELLGDALEQAILGGVDEDEDRLRRRIRRQREVGRRREVRERQRRAAQNAEPAFSEESSSDADSVVSGNRRRVVLPVVREGSSNGGHSSEEGDTDSRISEGPRNFEDLRGQEVLELEGDAGDAQAGEEGAQGQNEPFIDHQQNVRQNFFKLF